MWKQNWNILWKAKSLLTMKIMEALIFFPTRLQSSVFFYHEPEISSSWKIISALELTPHKYPLPPFSPTPHLIGELLQYLYLGGQPNRSSLHFPPGCIVPYFSIMPPLLKLTFKAIQILKQIFINMCICMYVCVYV